MSIATRGWAIGYDSDRDSHDGEHPAVHPVVLLRYDTVAGPLPGPVGGVEGGLELVGGLVGDPTGQVVQQLDIVTLQQLWEEGKCAHVEAGQKYGRGKRTRRQRHKGTVFECSVDSINPRQPTRLTLTYNL